MAHTDKKNEILVGTFVGLGLVLIAALILTFSRVSDVFQERYDLMVTFPSADELSTRSPVRLGGADIGSVAGKPRLNESFDGVIVDLEINDAVRIPEGSSFKIAVSGLMGDSYVKIEPPAELTGKSIEEGASIQGVGTGGLGALTDAASDLSHQARAALADVQEALGKLNVALARINEGLLTEENIGNFRASFEKFGNVMNKIDEGILSDENVESIKTTLANFEDAGIRISEQVDDLEPILAEAKTAVSKGGAAMEKAGAAMEDIGETAERFSSAAGSFEGLMGDMAEGDGLMTALLTDEELKLEFISLVRNLRRHGVLFYRDSSGRGSKAKAAAGPGEGAGAGREAVKPPSSRGGSRIRGGRPHR